MIEKHCKICGNEIVKVGDVATHYEGKKLCECEEKCNLNRLQLELGSIATASFYAFQEQRIKSYNRLRNILFRKATGLELRDVQEKKEYKDHLKEFEDRKLYRWIKKLRSENKIDENEEQYMEQMFKLLDDAEEKERGYLAIVKAQVENQPVYTEFLQHIKGIAGLMTAMLLYYFGYCEKAPHASSLWAYAGLTPDSKYVKGVSAKFNKNCRMFMWRISDSFVKQRTPRYRPIYDAEKARQMKLLENKDEHAPTRLGHADARARRKMVKAFLLDYYVVCKQLTGQPYSKPYVIEKLGHTHYDDIIPYLKKLKLKVGVSQEP